jgi:hypothetical protein
MYIDPVHSVHRSETYRRATADRFKGNVSDFLRAAADALAEQLGHPVKPPDDSTK